MRILGIETSCDETGVAIYDDKQGLLIHKVYSQSKVHSHYGGVVPELASRNHITQLSSLVQSVLTNINIKEINAIAYTSGPGLIGSLLVGATIGSALAYSWNIPTILVNHLEGHLLSPMLEINSPKFPFIALLVSGGHTQLISAKKLGEYTLLGNTLDDAAGEAFDKIAKLLGLSYPGGAELSELAQSGQVGRFFFPRPMTRSAGLNFSFSGLKTFATNFFYKSIKDFQTRADIARAFEDALVDTLLIKCKRALNIKNCNTLVVSGGVSANNVLRSKLDKIITDYAGKVQVFYPRKEFCTDNAAMIAYTGMCYFKLGEKFFHSNLKIKVNPNWSIVES